MTSNDMDSDGLSSNLDKCYFGGRTTTTTAPSTPTTFMIITDLPNATTTAAPSTTTAITTATTVAKCKTVCLNAGQNVDNLAARHCVCSSRLIQRTTQTLVVFVVMWNCAHLTQTMTVAATKYVAMWIPASMIHLKTKTVTARTQLWIHVYMTRNDMDSDGLFSNLDSCPTDSQNGAGSDHVICGHKNSCPYDAENDRDSNSVCANTTRRLMRILIFFVAMLVPARTIRKKIATTTNCTTILIFVLGIITTNFTLTSNLTQNDLSTPEKTEAVSLIEAYGYRRDNRLTPGGHRG